LTRAVHFAILLASAGLALWAIGAAGAPAFSLVPHVAPDALRLDFAVTQTALPFLALVALVVPGVALWGVSRGAAADGAKLALFVVTMIGVFLAQSVAAFFVCWEAMALVSALLIAAHHGLRDVRRALLSYLIVSQTGAFCILAALALLAAHAGSTQFAAIAQASGGLAPATRTAATAFALVGFGSKAGLVPLHFWLPRAHPVAPANASALLSGVMLNVAVYGLLVFAFALAAPLPLAWGFVIIGVGLVSALTGALFAAVDTDLKKLLAFSSIEHLGIVVATLGLAIAANAAGLAFVTFFALVALLLHALSHGVFKALLFLGAGTVAEAARTTSLEHLGGLGRALPFTTPLVFIGCLAAAALPPTGGFASEWLVFRSFIAAPAATPFALHGAMIAAVAALALTGGFGALAFAKLFGTAFLGASRTRHPVAPERRDAAVAGIGWLAVALLAIGCVPQTATAPLQNVALSLVRAVAPAGFPGPLPGTFAVPGLALVLLPFAGAIGALLLARSTGVRAVPVWTCGSPVTPRAQYTATAFSKPLRRIFGFVLLPDRQRLTDTGPSPWFPVRIRYAVKTRDVVDEIARRFAAYVQRFARRARIVQAGRLRVYIVYAVVAVLALLVAAR
jgi:formate hydrogenlyase subunit 3/multisubunit Na+/H+ antiporter MnhD subunit